MRETAANGPWAEKLAPVIASREKLASPDWYYRILKPHAAQINIWRTSYYHPLPGPAAIVDWFKGSGLRPYLAILEPVEQAAFLSAYLIRLAPHFPPGGDGSVLLPFPRLFFVAQR
jgi:trans-aconitate 2-methyltransferase